MDRRMEAAATITAALLRDYQKPKTETIVELLIQSLDAVNEAISIENTRTAKKHAALKMNTVVPRR
jgi:uncharacterized protein YwlG (UPF0340 family)